MEAEVFKQWYQQKCSIPGLAFTAARPFAMASVQAPTLTVCRLDEQGCLHLQADPIKVFFQSDAVAMKAKSLWDEVEAAASKADAPKWQPSAQGPNPMDPIQATQDADPTPSNQLPMTYPTLEKCLDASPPGDVTSANANFRVLVTSDGQGYAKCIRGTTVAQGEAFVSCGGGARLDEEASKKKMEIGYFAFPCELLSGGALVAYRKETMTTSTFYALHGQILLEGNPRVELSYHQITPKAGASSLERMELAVKRKRHWVCTKPRSDTNSLRWDNIARLVNLEGIPNNMLQLAWELKKEMQGGAACLVFERPFLAFSRAMTFEANDWFRWA